MSESAPSEGPITRIRRPTLHDRTAELLMVEWTLPAIDSPTPQVHVHHHDDELWYVMEGRLVSRLGDQESETAPGGVVMARHGTAHAFWCAGPAPTRCLTMMTKRGLQLLEELEATPLRTQEMVEAIFRKYDSEFLAG
ncbi:MAG TPA: cupin domain-containing protein [Candidatus Dormibacteraeota bacterium]|nr:cupin domain-containing protein [Candidatus Dormibacteraeota bacterium]